MLEFLQTGKALYVLAAICGMGMFSKLVTSSLYKRLIKETGNMALTKNKNLRLLKQKTENAFLLSHGIRNVSAYIERQMYNFRFMNLSLDMWENVSVQAMIVCFLLGGLAAFGSYWYRCDSYYIVLYGTMGIFSGLFLVLVDNGTNVSLKRRQLLDTLVDYVENSPHFYKASGKQQDHTGSERRMNKPAAEQKGRIVQMEAAASGTESTAGENKRESKRIPLLSRRKDQIDSAIKPGMNEQERTSLAGSIDSLKQSLDQIAASREWERRDLQVVKTPDNEKTDRARKELSEEDLKILGELLQEYLK